MNNAIKPLDNGDFEVVSEEDIEEINKFRRKHGLRDLESYAEGYARVKKELESSDA